jgi:1-acyl-sn-glycerol-3-phosphate acyltransferase
VLLLRNLAFYIAFYGGSVLLSSMAVVASWFDEGLLRRTVRRWSQFHRWCVTRLLRVHIRLEGHVSDRPVLYAIRHESFFEAIDMPALFTNPSVFAKQELFAIPLWGRAAAAFGLVPVARGDGARALMAMVKAAKSLHADGRPLVIFPEGTRVPHGAWSRLRAGFAGLYKLLGLPVVPVAVDSGPVYHRRWKRPGSITYRFGEELPPGLPRAEIEARVEQALNALNRLGTPVGEGQRG